MGGSVSERGSLYTKPKREKGVRYTEGDGRVRVCAVSVSECKYRKRMSSDIINFSSDLYPLGSQNKVFRLLQVLKLNVPLPSRPGQTTSLSVSFVEIKDLDYRVLRDSTVFKTILQKGRRFLLKIFENLP